jgi:hypothetical protein
MVIIVFEIFMRENIEKNSKFKDIQKLPKKLFKNTQKSQHKKLPCQLH